MAQLLQQAEAADRRDQDPQKLPQDIARREKLLQKMDASYPRILTSQDEHLPR